ncbi:unnamed protein product, partial [Aphanomyces euteiches]
MASRIQGIVQGMRCQRKCTARIQQALEEIHGIKSAQVSFKDKQAIIDVEDGMFVSVVDLIQTARAQDAGTNKKYDAYLPSDTIDMHER